MLSRHREILDSLVLVAAIGAAAPVAGQNRQPQTGRQPGNGAQQTENFARTFKVGANAALVLANISGRVEVTAGAGDQVDVKAVKRVASGTDATRRLANTVIDARAVGNRIELKVEAADRSQRGTASVDFDVHVPPECTVDVHSVSGDVRVTNVKGELRAEAVSGNLELDSASKITFVKTVSGDIRIANSGGGALAAVSSVSGSLTARDWTARSVDIDTVSGDFSLTGWSGERLSFRSVSGGLNLSGGLAKGGRYDLQSHSGDIRLGLADQPGFEVDADSFSGNITIDFSIRSEGPVRARGRRTNSIRGTYGDASASLHLQTFSGDIAIAKR